MTYIGRPAPVYQVCYTYFTALHTVLNYNVCDFPILNCSTLWTIFENIDCIYRPPEGDPRTDTATTAVAQRSGGLYTSHAEARSDGEPL